MILIDSNVIIDVIERDDRWQGWSRAQIEAASLQGRTCVSAIVVAEVAPSFPSLEQFVDELATLLIDVEFFTPEAGFLAGIAFRAYLGRREAMQAKSLIADFLIGGHAQALGATLLTRDPRFYSRYFPDLTLITPETHPHG